PGRLLASAALAFFTCTLSAATFVVTTTNDSGAGSLRQAIIDANATVDADTVTFAIGSGQQTIILSAALPAIARPLTIDGTTQPGYAGKPLIGINGLFVTAPAPNASFINGLEFWMNGAVQAITIGGFHSSNATAAGIA